MFSRPTKCLQLAGQRPSGPATAISQHLLVGHDEDEGVQWEDADEIECFGTLQEAFTMTRYLLRLDAGRLGPLDSQRSLRGRHENLRLLVWNS